MWDRLKGSAELMAKADVDPFALTPWLPYLTISEFHENPFRLRYRLVGTEVVRFGDLDPQGHVNQAVFNTYFESGRVAMLRNKDLGIGVPGATFVLVRIEIYYRR